MKYMYKQQMQQVMRKLSFIILLILFSFVNGEVLFPDECRKPNDFWACSDCDKCQTLYGCSDEDALYRAGYYCSEWPFFNQVSPPRTYQDNVHTWALYLPLETKHITCEAHNQTTCLEWEERKESQTELAVTDCVCENYVYGGNSDYCSDWGCEGIGLKKCDVYDYDCGTSHTIGSITYTDDCCGYRSCGDDCSEFVQFPKTMRDEFQNCTCIKPAVDEYVGDTRTVFCEKWECIDYANTAGKYNYLEYETHTCSKRNADFGYCEDWDWQTDDYDSFENTACECVDVMTTGAATTCRQFECLEKGAEKISPNLLWSIFGGVFTLDLIRRLAWPETYGIITIVYGAIYIALLFPVGIADMATSTKFNLMQKLSDGYECAHADIKLAVVFYFASLTVIPCLFGGVGTLAIVLVFFAILLAIYTLFRLFSGKAFEVGTS